MKIESTFTLDLSAGDKSRLAEAFGVSEENLAKTLSSVAEAATTEFAEMVLGSADTTRASSLREYRLVLLTETVFGGELPSEELVTKLFRCTRSQARTLIDGVLARYDHRVGTGLTRTCSDVIRAAKQEKKKGGDYEVAVISKYIVESLNQRLQRIDPSLPRIRPKTGTTSTFVIKPSARDALAESFGRE